jgi:undecaprenyl diphosphate synthase
MNVFSFIKKGDATRAPGKKAPSLLKSRVKFRDIALKSRVDINRLPVHIAIVLDGNGRWATHRGLPRTAGHAVGAETFRTVATFAKELGIKYLTVYAFSTENWKRPKEEVDEIWRLLRIYLLESLEKMERDKVKIHIMGDVTDMPEDVAELLRKIRETSSHIDGIQLNICLNYGGRAELTYAVRLAAEKCVKGELKPEEITEETIPPLLYSAGIPDPDLIIRPSGEYRLSNFLLWQSAYSEFYFTPVLWPDFTPEELCRAIIAYQNRNRRYGAVGTDGKNVSDKGKTFGK